MQEVSQKAEKEEMENRKIIKWKPNVQIIEVPGRVKEKKENKKKKTKIPEKFPKQKDTNFQT